MLSSLTPQETTVVDWLRQHPVATLAQLGVPHRRSHMTVFRALRKVGYYTSLNLNATGYTLGPTPAFDAEGLWRYQQWVFSRHGTLTHTLQVLVHDAPAGYTVRELDAKLLTTVGNLLSRLARAHQLACRRVHRQAVYLAVEAPQQARQWTQREALLTPTPPPVPLALPAHWPAEPLLRLLVRMIQRPRASAAQLAHQLHGPDWDYPAAQVQQVIDFYDLKKKRHPGRG